MKKRKKILIIVLSIVATITIAIGITLAVLLTRKPENPPEAKEGTIYQTKSESFWVGNGSGYMSFDYIKEPTQKEEEKLYGYVFRVYAKNKGAWEAWLSGSWEMNEEKTELILIATWDTSDSNATKLTDALSGETKKYTLQDGKFKIGVSYPGGSTGSVTFILDPIANKVGEEEIPTPPCTNHVDNDCNGVCDNEGCNEKVEIKHIDIKNNETQADGADGKCDKCGITMPNQSETKLMLSMNATDATTTMEAEIKMYDNKTFDFLLPSMGGKVFGGTWVQGNDGPMAPITLTVDSTGSAVVGETIIVTITPSQDYTSMTYTCHVDYVVPATITMAFDFIGILNLA